MALAELRNQRLTRGDSAELAEKVWQMAASNYAVEFDEHRALSRGSGPSARPRESAWKTRDSCASAMVTM